MDTGADDETTSISSKISFKSKMEEWVQVMDVLSLTGEFHPSSGSSEEEIRSKGTCDEKGIKLRKASTG